MASFMIHIPPLRMLLVPHFCSSYIICGWVSRNDIVITAIFVIFILEYYMYRYTTVQFQFYCTHRGAILSLVSPSRIQLNRGTHVKAQLETSLNTRSDSRLHGSVVAAENVNIARCTVGRCSHTLKSSLKRRLCVSGC